MKHQLDVTFAHDYDSSLYMLSNDPGAKNWKVIVHCKDGQKHVPSIERFVAYPGCDTHEGKTAWLIEYYEPEKIEIRRPSRTNVVIKHPDA